MRSFFFAVAAWSALAGSAAASPNQVIGSWLTKDSAGQVEISPCGASVCGVLKAANDAPAGQLDVRNPDPELRSRPVVGITMMQGFTRTATGWTGGSVYDPKTGRTYRGKLTPRPDGTLALEGCIRGTPLCRTEVWTPTTAAAP